MKASPEILELSGYLSVTDASRQLGVSRKTLNRWYREGRVAMFRVGEVCIVPHSELQRIQAGWPKRPETRDKS